MAIQQIGNSMKIIKEIKPKPCKELIELLEDLLAFAKSGEIQGLAFAVIGQDRTTLSGWSGGDYSPMMMLAEMSILQRDFMDTKISLKSNEN